MKSKKQPTAGQLAFEHVFIKNAWGNRANAGKNYVRPYSKTNSSAKEHMAKCDAKGLPSYSGGKV